MYLLDLQQQRPNTLDVESAVAADLGPVYPDGDDYERSHIPPGRPEERVREGAPDCRVIEPLHLLWQCCQLSIKVELCTVKVMVMVEKLVLGTRVPINNSLLF